MGRPNLRNFKRMYLAVLFLGSLALILFYFIFVGDDNLVYKNIKFDNLAQVFLAISGSLFASFLVIYIAQSIDEATQNELNDRLVSMEFAISTSEVLACKYIAQKVPHRILDGLIGPVGGRRYFTAMGVTLTPLREYIQRIAKISDFNIDLVLPSLDDQTLVRIAEREGRNVESLRESIMQIKTIASDNKNKATIRLRFSMDIPN